MPFSKCQLCLNKALKYFSITFPVSVTKYLGKAASRGSVCFSLQFDGTVHHDREDTGKEQEVAGQEAERNECPCKCSLLSMESWWQPVDWVGLPVAGKGPGGLAPG